jgi:enterochelin esterase-like enzyme
VRPLYLSFIYIGLAVAEQTNPIEALVTAARNGSPDLSSLVKSEMPKGGVQVWGQDYLFVGAGAKPMTISIDDQPVVVMRALGEGFWYRIEKMRTGVTHSYQFYADGKPQGQRGDATGYNPDSYPKPGVPKGVLSDKKTITSKIYEGMTADYWYYASPGVDPATPAPLMVWQDGQGLIGGDRSRLRLFTVTENLIAQKLIPPMVHVMISPGFLPDKTAMRAVEYDTVSDRYGRFVMQEVLPEVEKVYKLRSDGYSRAIGGESSGGICSFTMAWFFPDKFARVHSTIGSYTSIKWHVPENSDGGNAYPFKIRKEPKRNIRVWLSDGVDDLENEHGSWPLQNIQMANSLKRQGYDFHFRLGTASHNSAQAALDLPESLAWLWRGYDPAKTEQVFEMDPAEKDKPLFRVKLLNRDAW